MTDYEKKYGKITKENYKEYLAVLRAKSCMRKAKLDRLGITEENAKEISEYADDMYSLEKYDEVEAEHNTLKALKVLRR